MNMQRSVGMRKILIAIGTVLFVSVPWLSAMSTTKTPQKAASAKKTATKKVATKKTVMVSIKDIEKSAKDIKDPATKAAFNQTIRYLKALQSSVKRLSSRISREKRSLSPAKIKARKEALAKKLAEQKKQAEAVKKATTKAADVKKADAVKESRETLVKGAVKK